MRGYVVLLAVGIVAALIGLGVLFAGFRPQTHPLVFTITAGASHYVRYEFSIVTGGTISGSFAVDSGTVNVWVMTDAQHATFIGGGTLSYLSASSGSSGTFFANLPSGGTYFLETGHGGGYEPTVQTGTEAVTIGNAGRRRAAALRSAGVGARPRDAGSSGGRAGLRDRPRHRARDRRERIRVGRDRGAPRQWREHCDAASRGGREWSSEPPCPGPVRVRHDRRRSGGVPRRPSRATSRVRRIGGPGPRGAADRLTSLISFSRGVRQAVLHAASSTPVVIIMYMRFHY